MRTAGMSSARCQTGGRVSVTPRMGSCRGTCHLARVLPPGTYGIPHATAPLFRSSSQNGTWMALIGCMWLPISLQDPVSVQRAGRRGAGQDHWPGRRRPLLQQGGGAGGQRPGGCACGCGGCCMMPAAAAAVAALSASAADWGHRGRRCLPWLDSAASCKMQHCDAHDGCPGSPSCAAWLSPSGSWPWSPGCGPAPG